MNNIVVEYNETNNKRSCSIMLVVDLIILAVLLPIFIIKTKNIFICAIIILAVLASLVYQYMTARLNKNKIEIHDNMLLLNGKTIYIKDMLAYKVLRNQTVLSFIKIFYSENNIIKAIIIPNVFTNIDILQDRLNIWGINQRNIIKWKILKI